uniref:Cyclic nucleotide-gated cation channel beta-3-like n=1 Tax=Neolamprologus brichardi TaxID=32507 RepID=A0A3Q4H5M9_NEOBR
PSNAADKCVLHFPEFEGWVCHYPIRTGNPIGTLHAQKVSTSGRKEGVPPPPPPIVINKYSDEHLRAIIINMRERKQLFKEKVIDQYASSPEITPPVKERKQQAEEARIKKEEADKKKKEEQEKKKKEDAQKKAEQKTDLMDSVFGQTIDPFTDRRYIAWLSLVTVAINYNTWFITARLCFPYHTEISIPYWFTLDVLADIIYLVDSVISQPRKQFVKGGDIIKDRVMTKKHYRDSERFLADVVSVLPFDLLYIQFGFKSAFRLNRLLKIDTFFEFSDRLESIMAKAYIWSYLSCFFYAEKSLLLIAELPTPDTTFGLIFQMTNYLFGAFFMSTMLGQMRDVIGAATAGQTYFRSSMDNTVEYMVTNHIPSLIQNRVRTWYTYTWDAQGMLDESELLDKMPLVMRTAIAVDINLATFQKIDLFKGCDQQMLVDMLLRLKSIIYLPGDFVVKKGDIGKEMYIIKGGAVQVVGGPDNSIVFVTLKAGCVFGEISLLQSSKDGGNRRTANVKAYGFANLFVLEKKDLFDILVHYPESQKVLARKGKKLMKAKGPAAAKVEEEKKKGLALFGPKPPTPKLLRNSSCLYSFFGLFKGINNYYVIRFVITAIFIHNPPSLESQM